MSKKKIARLLIHLYEIQKIYGRINESDLIRIAIENKINLYKELEKREARKKWRIARERKKSKDRKKEINKEKKIKGKKR